jgi:hypothetical protein
VLVNGHRVAAADKLSVAFNESGSGVGPAKIAQNITGWLLTQEASREDGL